MRNRRKRRRIIEDDSEEDQDGTDGNEDDGWTITGILGERFFFDGHGFQRQYWVQRADEKLTKKRNSPAKYTNADTHDKTDMPESVLIAWRGKQPLDKLLWIYGGKEKKGSAKVKKILAMHQAKWEKL
jgi:hypothetical protein